MADWYDFTEGPATNQSGEQKLRPESTNSLDIGIGYLASGIRLHANYYRTRYSDKIESVLDFLDRRNTINAGNAIFQGVEFEAAATIGRFDFSSATTISRNRWQEMKVNKIFGSRPDDVLGKVVPFSPEQTAFASIAYNMDDYRFKLGLNWWDDYYATFTNEYTRSNGSVAPAKLPHYFDLSAQLSHSTRIEHLDVTFRIDVNNILNRSDNFLRAQYTADFTRNDALAGQFHWYVL
ncbi:TonB-dependent receptor [bacterium]|nr:TonB-dependent receptor [bacterium]